MKIGKALLALVGLDAVVVERNPPRSDSVYQKKKKSSLPKAARRARNLERKRFKAARRANR